MSSANPQKPPVCFLFDNGSLRPDATFSLREVAVSLAAMLGQEVKPVSLLHSSAIPPKDLEGEAAQLLEEALADFLQREPEAKIVALPLFFGPSGALTDYVPRILSGLRTRFPRTVLKQARCLVAVDEADLRIAQALANRVMVVIQKGRLIRPKVVLVDHGSPVSAVTSVRDHLGGQLRALLGNAVDAVSVASMERRAGPEYEFNEPLFARRLRQPPFSEGDVVVALQFLSPGRHAGASGDVAGICAEACSELPALRTHITDTIARDAGVVAVLADRYREAAGP